MTDVVRQFTLTLPPNGLITTITRQACQLEDSNVTKILLTFPPGCAGLVGVKIEHGGNQVYPFTANTFFIFDDYTVDVDPSSQSTSGQWAVAGYNTDLYQHTVQAYFFYNHINLSASPQSSQPVSL